MDIFHCFQVVHLKLKDLEAAEPMTDPSTSPIFAASGMAWQDLGRSSKMFQDVQPCSTGPMMKGQTQTARNSTTAQKILYLMDFGPNAKTKKDQWINQIASKKKL